LSGLHHLALAARKERRQLPRREIGKRPCGSPRHRRPTGSRSQIPCMPNTPNGRSIRRPRKEFRNRRSIRMEEAPINPGHSKRTSLRSRRSCGANRVKLGSVHVTEPGAGAAVTLRWPSMARSDTGPRPLSRSGVLSHGLTTTHTDV
jgi:hypothetical protein